MRERRTALSNNKGIPDEMLAKLLEAKAQGARLRKLADGRPWDGNESLLDEFHHSQTIIIDVTATDQTVPLLLEARKRNWGIVLANKRPLAGPYEIFHELTSSRLTRFETTVAAALPVIHTLQSFLLDTGDEIKKIRGCVSGTLNIICQRLEQGKKFSDIVRDAKSHGHTEPDPREDLAGRDAARKALILARLLGYPLELNDIEAEPLYPLEMNTLSVEEFLESLPQLDEKFLQLSREVQSQDRKPRYVIEVSDGRFGRAGRHPPASSAKSTRLEPR